MIIIEVFTHSFKYLFLLFSIFGFLISFLLFYKPNVFYKLNEKMTKDIKISQGSNEPELPGFGQMEHIFFNHHVKTSVVMIISSLFVIVSFQKTIANRQWELFLNQQSNEFIKICFQVLIPFIFINAVLGLFMGFFILIKPEYAFRVLRVLSKTKKRIISEQWMNEKEKSISVIVMLLSIACFFTVIMRWF